MKKNYLAVAIALVAFNVATAQQKVTIGLKGGLNIPNITSGGEKTPLSEGYSSRMAWGAGVFAEFQYTKTFSIRVGLEYSGQGGKKTGMQAMPTDLVFGGVLSNTPSAQQQNVAALIPVAKSFLNRNYLYADIESVARFNYLMLPIQAKFGWNFNQTSPFRVYVSGGLFLSYLMSAQRISSGTSAIYADPAGTTMTAFWSSIPAAAKSALPIQVNMGIASVFTGMDQPKSMDRTQNITDDLHPFNFGVIANAGVSYTFAHKHSIFIEGGGNYGFLKIQNNVSNGQNRIGAATVMLGYSYTLGK